MATLVLSTVGTALGGPIGGAIGSLLGQTIDQQLFGPGPRHGPRLGDLSVQSSSYGNAIPRLYGTMRVAGTVIWATDLKESSETYSGAKGQPESVTYSYSVSMAVALSSRRAVRVKRIWADGKLLRGAAGDFKVSTGFRFHPGSEDQEIDPLIASIEGIAETPAYRGLSVAVFEDLQLAEYGNRIPFLTFEVEADESLSLGDLLSDASGGTIASPAARLLGGYAAYGRSIRAALQPLVEQIGIELFDDGQVLRSPAEAAPTIVAEQELGCSASSEPAPRSERTQVAARSLPTSLTLGYYDPARDFQTGQMRASAGASGGEHDRLELPVATSAEDAKALAQSSLARRWAQRDRLTVRLAPTFLDLEPGSILLPPGEWRAWVAETVKIDGMAVVADLRPQWSQAAALPAEPGRTVPAVDVVASPTMMALLDLPDLGVRRHDLPILDLAACSSNEGWRAVPLEIIAGGELRSGQTAFGEAVMGAALSALGDGQSFLFDLRDSLEVQLFDAEHWLESRDDAALAQGANLAAVGSELIQFGRAIPLGSGRFRLERLLRGRRGTEWAMDTHVPGDSFVLLGPNSLRAIELPREAAGSTVEVRAMGIGDGADNSITAVAGGEAMRPPSPVHLKAGFGSDGSLHISWVRRSRHGWAWLDEMDAPLGEGNERYRIRIDAAGGAIEEEILLTALQIGGAQLGVLGSGAAVLTVVQIGDFAVSRPSALHLNLP